MYQCKTKRPIAFYNANKIFLKNMVLPKLFCEYRLFNLRRLDPLSIPNALKAKEVNFLPKTNFIRGQRYQKPLETFQSKTQDSFTEH